jgi:hypothetical protein
MYVSLNHQSTATEKKVGTNDISGMHIAKLAIIKL